MSYPGNLPVSSRSWQRSLAQPAVIDQEWWELFDLLLEAPSILTQYVLLKLRCGVGRVFGSRRERSARWEVFSGALRRFQRR
jgi:hypothetical protein